MLRLMLPCVKAPGGAGAAGSASGPRRPAPGAPGERWVVPARSVLLDRSGGRRPTSRGLPGRPRTRAVGRAGLRPLSRLAVLPPAGCPGGTDYFVPLRLASVRSPRRLGWHVPRQPRRQLCAALLGWAWGSTPVLALVWRTRGTSKASNGGAVLVEVGNAVDAPLRQRRRGSRLPRIINRHRARRLAVAVHALAAREGL